MLDAGDKLALVAASKQRKSFLFLMLALALASGRDLLAWRIPQPRRVAYVQFEIRKHHNHRRLKNLARAMGITAEDLGARLLIIPGRGLGLKGVEGLERIQKAVSDFRPEVIMLDPLYKIADGVENAAEDFKVLLNAFDQFAEQTGASVLFVHHDTKGTPGDKDIRDRGAGSGVLGRDYDACITLTSHASEPDAAVVETLLRNYPPQEPFTIIWQCSRDGAYCFQLADDVRPEKRTSHCKPVPPPLASYLPVAREILIAGREVEIPFFKAELKERTRLSDHRIRDFMNWATGGEHPQMVTREVRGIGQHKKWVRMAEGRDDS
jgi:RecA-family ATPase